MKSNKLGKSIGMNPLYALLFTFINFVSMLVSQINSNMSFNNILADLAPKEIPDTDEKGIIENSSLGGAELDEDESVSESIEQPYRMESHKLPKINSKNMLQVLHSPHFPIYFY